MFNVFYGTLICFWDKDNHTGFGMGPYWDPLIGGGESGWGAFWVGKG